MRKFHGGGQELYTNIYIGVYMSAAKFAEYMLKFLRNRFVTLQLSLSTWSLLWDGRLQGESWSHLQHSGEGLV